MDVNLLRAALLPAGLGGPRRARKALMILSIPSLVLAGTLSWHAAQGRAGLAPGRAGLLMAAVLLGGGLLSGIWDGAPTLRFEGFRPFLAPPDSLFLAELAVSFLTPGKLFLGALGTSACLGASLARPWTLPATLPCVPLFILWLICLERMVGAATRHVTGSLRLASLYAGLFLGLRTLMKVALRGQALRSVPVAPWLLPAASWLPTTALAQAWKGGLGRGGFSRTSALLVLAWTLLLATGARLALRRDLQGEPRRPAAENAGRAWSFERPWVGIAKQRWCQILGSRNGRLFLFVPFLALLAMLEPFALGLHPGPAWIGGCLAWVLLPLGGKFSCALFGFDRSGVRSYWILPLEDADLLLGKLAGTLLYQFAVILLLVLAALFATPLPLPLCGAAFLLLCGVALAQSLAGLTHSIRNPLPLDPRGLNPNVLDDEGLKRMGLMLGAWAGPTLFWVLALKAAPRLLGPGLLLGLVLEGLAFRARFQRALALLAEHRDTLTASLEGRDPPGLAEASAPVS